MKLKLKLVEVGVELGNFFVLCLAQILKQVFDNTYISQVEAQYYEVDGYT